MKFLPLLLILFVSSASALDAQIATIEDAQCKGDPQDPNDLGYRFTSNSHLYAGQCLNGEKFRPIRNLQLSNNTATFDNYLHKNTFWKAQLPIGKNDIEAVYFQIMRFPVVEGVIAAHTQIRFVFKNKSAVQLKHLDQTATVEDVLISFEAAFPKTVSYNFALGAFPNYARVSKIMSMIQKQTDSPTGIEQYELQLTDEEKAALLQNTLVYSQDMGITAFYNTLRPNCTTEVFDQLDKLPRFKDHFSMFLTMISPDPIAGPSLKALNDRQLILRRVQNYEDEIQGQIGPLEMPKEKENVMTTFLPSVAGQPWTMTTVLPDTRGMSEAEKKVILSLREELQKTIPTLIQSYGSVMMLAPKESKGSQLFLSTLKELVSRLPEALRKINKDLPAERSQITLYFTPFENTETSTSLRSLGIPAQVPFAINDHQMDTSTKEGRRAGAELYSAVGTGISEAGEVGSKIPDSKAFLMGATIVIHAQKDNSQIVTQLLVGLAALEAPLTSESPQVAIKKIVIPQGSNRTDRPVMLITHNQDVKNKVINEFVDVQFGSFGGVAGSQGEYGASSLQVFKSSLFCNTQAASTPYFVGQISDKFTGIGFIDGIVKGGPIDFHIMRITLNLKTQKVADMDLKINALWLLSCLDNEEANLQFTQNANAAMTEMMNKTTNSDLLQLLSPLLN